MNKLTSYRLIIEFEIWEPFEKETFEEINTLIIKLKNKELLPHAGYIKTTERGKHEPIGE